MDVVSAILRRGLVGEHLVVGHVVPVNVIAGRAADNGRTDSEIADERGHCDIQHIISKTPAIWPSTRDHAAAKTSLDGTGQGIAAENAQPGESRVIGIQAAAGAIATQPAGTGRE